MSPLNAALFRLRGHEPRSNSIISLNFKFNYNASTRFSTMATMMEYTIPINKKKWNEMMEWWKRAPSIPLVFAHVTRRRHPKSDTRELPISLFLWADGRPDEFRKAGRSWCFSFCCGRPTSQARGQYPFLGMSFRLMEEINKKKKLGLKCKWRQ